MKLSVTTPISSSVIPDDCRTKNAMQLAVAIPILRICSRNGRPKVTMIAAGLSSFSLLLVVNGARLLVNAPDDRRKKFHGQTSNGS